MGKVSLSDLTFFTPSKVVRSPPRPIGTTTIRLTCSVCGREFDRPIGKHRYQLKRGATVFFCGLSCFGVSRRHNKTDKQKKADKAAYDDKYRRRDYVKRKKAEYFQRTYDPAKAAIERQKIMPRHIEYCRRPAYRAYKKEYDRKRVAKQNYGEFWESALLVRDIQALYSDDQVRETNNLHNKSQRRKRVWQRLATRNSPQAT